MLFIIEIESLKFVLFKLCWIQIHLQVVKPKTINRLYLTQINDNNAAAACSKTIQLVQLVLRRVHERNILLAPRLEHSIYQLVPSGSWRSIHWVHSHLSGPTWVLKMYPLKAYLRAYFSCRQIAMVWV